MDTIKKPFTTNQIKSTKPNAPRLERILVGQIGNSMNAGHNRTIAWKPIMAGERHKEYRLNASFKLLTPITPAYQNLLITFRTYFVPNSRVWKNAEKFTAQKGGASEIKINNVPYFNAKKFLYVPNNNYDKATSIQNTDIWRDCFASSYIPRVGNLNITTIDDTDNQTYIPPVSILPLRGRIAIYNDMERNKEYDEEILEYNDDTVSDSEIRSYIPDGINTNFDYYNMRSKRMNSYYTNYRTEIQGFEAANPENGEIEVEGMTTPQLSMSNDQALTTWSYWENLISESKSQSLNSQKNDWDIIAEIRGSKKLTEGKVQLLGVRTEKLNYASITQTSYNNNEQIEETFRVMGQQGAYSFTKLDIPLYAAVEFIEEGYIHVIATVQAENVFESGINRTELNVFALDQYRPDLEKQEYDVLYECETGTTNLNGTNFEQFYKAAGFKRKFTEYLSLPNIIGGDMVSKNYLTTKMDTTYNLMQIDGGQIITQKTYQFYEEDREYFYNRQWNPETQTFNQQAFQKKVWKDYSDLQLNKNQAIMNEIEIMNNTNQDYEALRIKGQNQIFFSGIHYCQAILPMNSEIADNYNEWGEH